ncbi:MAG: uroporphyrinogen-III synthase [Pseudomonadota bacterium]
MGATHVIVTRAEPGASETAARLTAMGLLPLISPALELIGSPEIALPDLQSVSGVVFTSANGVRFFAERSSERQLSAWCVGPATAHAARLAGFTKVEESSGNAADLANLILEASPPALKPLLHVANAAAKGNLKSILEARGRKITFCPLYRATTAPALSQTVSSLLQSETRAYLMVHSEKGAEAFVQLASDWQLSHLTGIAISPTVCEILKRAGLAEIHVAKAPNETELLNALQVALSAHRR